MNKKIIFVLLIVASSVCVQSLWAGGNRDSSDNSNKVGIEKPGDNRSNREKLLQMAKSGDEQGLERMLKVDINLDETDSSGQTALHIASAAGHSSITALFLLQGAQVDAIDDLGRSPLILAVENQHSEVMKLLVSHGADIALFDSKGRSAATMALDGTASLLTALLNDSNINQTVSDSKSLLHLASARGRQEHVQALINAGADVALKDRDGRTALDLALSGNVGENQIRTAAVLVQAGSPTPAEEEWRYIVKVFRGGNLERRFDFGSTALHLASERGQEGMVRYLLSEGAEVNVVDQPGSTPLHVAVRRGYQRIAEALLDAGADVNAQDYNGNVPIHESLGSVESYALTSMLLNRGADSNIKNGSGSTALHLTVMLQNSPKIAELLLAGGALIDPRDRNGNTPLLLAAQGGEKDLAVLFLNHGAAIFARNNRGITPVHVALGSSAEVVTWFFTDKRLIESDNEGRTVLHLAVELESNLEVLRVLLSAGAEPNQRDSNGATAFHYAVNTGLLPQAGILLENRADIFLEDNSGASILTLVFEKGSFFTTQLLANHIDISDAEGKTPLFHAVRWQYPAIASALLEAGADPNHKDRHGQSALHEAVRANSGESVKILISAGADADLADRFGKTALHDAVLWGVVDMARLLVQEGANPDARDTSGQTALHLAAFAGNLEIAQWLLSNGAAANVRDAEGRTPLFVAAEADRVMMGRLLVDNGGSVFLRDEDGGTALHSALRRGNSTIAKFLISRGADFFAVDANGETPFDLALSGGARLLRSLLDENLSNRQDNRGNTPLHLAVAARSDTSVLRAILDAGADRLARNAQGLTPSQLASSLGDAEKASIIR